MQHVADPVLRWLAEWIGKSMQDVLVFPNKADKRAQLGSGWTPAELNSILQNHVVNCTILIVPPFPYNVEDDHLDDPLEDCWYASPQLFFTCALRPKGGRRPKNSTYKTCPDDQVHSFVFFSTFEELDLPIKGPMEDAGVTVTKLYAATMNRPPPPVYM